MPWTGTNIPRLFRGGSTHWRYQFNQALYILTTPIAYLSTVAYYDPFSGQMVNPWAEYWEYLYFNYEIEIAMTGDTKTGYSQYRLNGQPAGPYGDVAWSMCYQNIGKRYYDNHRAFLLWSAGPDMINNMLYWGECETNLDYQMAYVNSVYDPSNGTMSSGDLCRLGGSYVNHFIANASQ